MIKTWNFPAGEVGVRIEEAITSDAYMVQLLVPNSDEVMRMLFLVDAIRRAKPDVRLSLNVPYFPYARQDRVMQAGESHSLRVFASLINWCNFDRVYVADPHSDVVEALVDNLCIMRQEECALETVSKWDYQYLIAPDAGALKKIYKLSEKVGIPVICANKVREVSTGKITGISINPEDYAKITGKVLVVDDILDGGATFLELADALPNVDKHIYVTHGIFSKGKSIIQDKYSEIFCYNDMSVIQ